MNTNEKTEPAEKTDATPAGGGSAAPAEGAQAPQKFSPEDISQRAQQVLGKKVATDAAPDAKPAAQAPSDDKGGQGDKDKPGDPAKAAAPAKPNPDANPALDAMLKEYGLTTIDDLKPLLGKAKEHDTLSQTIQQLNEKLAKKPFANEYVEKLNNLHAKGATPDQIKAFEQVNALGDLTKADQLDIKKLALQLRDGLSAEEATRYLNIKYKLDPEVHTQEEIDDTKLLLKMEIGEDRKFLEDHIGSLTTDNSTEKEAALNAERQKYSDALDKVIPELASNFVSIKDINVNGKKGEEAVLMPEFIIPEETRKLGPALVKDFMQRNNLPINADNLKEASKYAQDMLAFAHFDDLVISAANHLASVETKKILEKYHIAETIVRDKTGANNELQLAGLDKFKQNRLRGVDGN